MHPRGFLITGTDTGVGKTFVGCVLAGELRRRGLRVAPFKPAETGCAHDPQTGLLVPSDAVQLREASGSDVPIEAICPYRFRPPVAPWVAARQQMRQDDDVEDKEIDPSFLSWQFQELAANHDIVIVETAGGILVPLGERFHFGDLARQLSLPVLVVAANRLGVLNHTLLTLEFLRHAGLPTLGVVLNHPVEDASPAALTNAESLRRLAAARLFVFPPCPPGQVPRQAAQELAEHILNSLLH